MWCASQRRVYCDGVCDDSACVVLLCCGLWNGGGVVWCEGVCGLVACLPLLPLLSILSSSSLLVFEVARAQPSEHVRYPRTPLCSLVVFSSLCSSFLYAPPFFSPISLLAPPFRVWNGGGGYHVSECLVGMTATGSLSLSSPFFW